MMQHAKFLNLVGKDEARRVPSRLGHAHAAEDFHKCLHHGFLADPLKVYFM